MQKEPLEFLRDLDLDDVEQRQLQIDRNNDPSGPALEEMQEARTRAIAQTYGQGEPLKHKDFVVVTMKITAHGFLSKMCGEILHKSAKDGDPRRRLQLKETLEDGRVLYELTNFEKIN